MKKFLILSIVFLCPVAWAGEPSQAAKEQEVIQMLYEQLKYTQQQLARHRTQEESFEPDTTQVVLGNVATMVAGLGIIASNQYDPATVATGVSNMIGGFFNIVAHGLKRKLTLDEKRSIMRALGLGTGVSLEELDTEDAKTVS